MGNCQQFELYGAEDKVPAGETISPDGLQRYVDQLRENPYWERAFGESILRIDAHVRPDSRDGSVGGYSRSGLSGSVEMAPVHLNELAILHEVAHVCASARYGSKAHDPWFARTYLELVSVFMGPVAYQALDAAFRADGIDSEVEGPRRGIAL